MSQKLMCFCLLIIGLNVGLASDGWAIPKSKNRSLHKAKSNTREGNLRALNKIRPDSLLRQENKGQLKRDYRSIMEKQRDHEIFRHYQRIAELDVIESIAKNENDNTTLEQVVVIRRKEMRRFWKAMQSFRNKTKSAYVRGQP